VIVVTRLNGPRFGVNPDLLQRVESAPDTILTLIDGTKYIVEESMEAVIDRIQEHRAQLLARAHQIEAFPPARVELVPDLVDAAADTESMAPPVPLRPRSR